MGKVLKKRLFHCLNWVREGAVAEIRLNRPEALNAFNVELAEELGRALNRAAKEKEVRAVVIRGEGRAFSAGGDLKMFHRMLPRADRGFHKISALLHSAVKTIRTMPKPVIAGVHGPAFAAAFGLTLACDLILASESSTFSASYINVALTPNGSATLYLPRLVGCHRASELFFTGRVLTAKEALQWGIVNRVVKDGKFEKALSDWARDLASRPTLSIGRTKELLNRSLSLPIVSHLEAEKNAIAWSSTTPDFTEGVSAFVKKRKPQFKGR
ncbi:MAG: enoyl-CoA hydratase-related protein [bacterium]